jgi:probable rRNA maturation factor
VKISVSNLNKRYRLNEAFVKKIAARVLRYIRKTGGLELEVVFLNDKSIRAMNSMYLHVNRATDVLSFRIERKEFGEDRFLGEVFISLDSALSNSAAFKTDFSEEIVLYIIHGILHLVGYTDYRQMDRVRMWRRQNRILRYLYTKEDLSRVLTRQ